MISLPPATKSLIILLCTLSLLGAGIQYYTLLKTIAQVESDYRDALYKARDKGFPDPARPGLPSINDIYMPYLIIVPVGQAIISKMPSTSSIWYPWTLVTATLVELNKIHLFISVFAGMYAARQLERAWSSRELVKYCIILAVIPNAIAWLVFSFVDIVEFNHRWDKDENFVYRAHLVAGTSALMAGLTVALKQVIPEHTLVMFKGRIRVSVKRLPFIYLLVSIVEPFVFDASEVYTFLATVGFFTAWGYLRYFKTSQAAPLLPFSAKSSRPAVSAGITIVGDASDSFALHTFFPEPLNFGVQRISHTSEEILKALHLWRPFSAMEIEAANIRHHRQFTSLKSFSHSHQSSTDSTFMSTLNLSARAEAERRRNAALSALDQQLRAQTHDSLVSPIQQKAKLPMRRE